MDFIHPLTVKIIKESVEKYGTSLRNKPRYVIVGFLDRPGLKSAGGPIAFAQNEMWAYKIKAVIAKMGHATVEKTEWHPDGPTFHVGSYFRNL